MTGPSRKRPFPLLSPLLAVATWGTAACAGSGGSGEFTTSMQGRAEPVGSLRAELPSTVFPDGPVRFTLSDSAYVALFEVIPNETPVVLFPEPAGGNAHLPVPGQHRVGPGEHVVGPAPRRPPACSSYPGIPPAVRYRLLLAAEAPLRLDRLRLRRIPGEAWYRVEAVRPQRPTEAAVEALRQLADPAEAPLASDVQAFPPREEECEERRTPGRDGPRD